MMRVLHLSGEEMKVALVTGASRGIGRAVAEALAEDGYHLAVAARSADALAALRKDVTGRLKEVDVLTFAVDIRDTKAIGEMVSDIVQHFERIDLLFNNAGIFHLGTADLSLDQFGEMIDVNLKAAFNLIHHVVPLMRKQRSGHIINLSSRSGKIGKPRSGGYAASKFGLVGLNEALYRDLAPLGIKVTAVCPGWVATEMADSSGLSRDEMIQTDDIVNTVRWLLALGPKTHVKEILIEPQVQAASL